MKHECSESVCDPFSICIQLRATIGRFYRDAAFARSIWSHLIAASCHNGNERNHLSLWWTPSAARTDHNRPLLMTMVTFTDCHPPGAMMRAFISRNRQDYCRRAPRWKSAFMCYNIDTIRAVIDKINFVYIVGASRDWSPSKARQSRAGNLLQSCAHLYTHKYNYCYTRTHVSRAERRGQSRLLDVVFP